MVQWPPRVNRFANTCITVQAFAPPQFPILESIAPSEVSPPFGETHRVETTPSSTATPLLSRSAIRPAPTSLGIPEVLSNHDPPQTAAPFPGNESGRVLSSSCTPPCLADL